MKKTLKKLISVLLSLIIIMSVAAVGFSAFAEDVETPESVEEVVPSHEEEHVTFMSLTIQFFKEVFALFKYIFYDVFLGKPVPDIKPVG